MFIGEHMAVDDDGRHVPLLGKPNHLVVGSGIAANVDFFEREAVFLQIFLGIEAPAAQVAGVKLDLSHDFSLCNGP